MSSCRPVARGGVQGVLKNPPFYEPPFSENTNPPPPYEPPPHISPIAIITIQRDYTQTV